MDEDYPATTQSGYLTRSFAPYIPNVPSGSYQNPEEDVGFWEGLWDRIKPSNNRVTEESYSQMLDNWNAQIQAEEGMSQTQREIEAEASFNPWEEMIASMGAMGMANSAAASALTPGQERRELMNETLRRAGEELELSRRRVSDRAEAVGTARTAYEMATPALSAATLAIPLGAGYRLAPQAFRATKLGRFMAPATGRFGKGVEYAANRIFPAAYISMSGANELPGQFAQNAADDIAAYGGFVATYGLGNVIKNALGPRGRLASRALTGGSIVGGVGAGLGSAIAAGNAVDRQRMQTGRNWAFQDQERLDWAYENHPEWFPEFNK